MSSVFSPGIFKFFDVLGMFLASMTVALFALPRTCDGSLHTVWRTITLLWRRRIPFGEQNLSFETAVISFGEQIIAAMRHKTSLFGRRKTPFEEQIIAAMRQKNSFGGQNISFAEQIIAAMRHKTFRRHKTAFGEEIVSTMGHKRSFEMYRTAFKVAVILSTG